MSYPIWRFFPRLPSLATMKPLLSSFRSLSSRSRTTNAKNKLTTLPESKSLQPMSYLDTDSGKFLIRLPFLRPCAALPAASPPRQCIWQSIWVISPGTAGTTSVYILCPVCGQRAFPSSTAPLSLSE